MENKRKLLSFFGALVGGFVLFELVTPLTSVRPQQQGCPCAECGAAEGPIVALRVPSLTVVDADMEEALAALRSKDPDHIIIGFERVPHAEGEKGAPICSYLPTQPPPRLYNSFAESTRGTSAR